MRHFAFVLFIFTAFVACTPKDKPASIRIKKDRSMLPRLHAVDVTTVISDSGVTRYRISAAVWDIFDRATQPYWEFPKGITLERFDEHLKVNANIHSKYAKYKVAEQLWELRGDVRMTNVQGQLFETSQLFWSQREEKFYSDSIIKITDATHIVKGIGFVSNQNMTNYQIRKTKMVLPLQQAGGL